MSSKAASGRMTKALFATILRHIRQEEAVPDEHRSTLYYLTRQGYITQDEEKYALLPKGAQLLTEEAVWSLTIAKPNRWDGKYRLVLFDIPKDKHKRRDSFRLRLKELGLVLYQNSVWLYPYPLEEEIRKIADFYKLSDCVSFIVAEKISNESVYRQHFKLKK